MRESVSEQIAGVLRLGVLAFMHLTRSRPAFLVNRRGVRPSFWLCPAVVLADAGGG